MLYHEDGSIKGIATNDVGIHKDGSPKVLDYFNLLFVISATLSYWLFGHFAEGLIDKFWYINIQPSKAIDLSLRLWGITTEFIGFIPQSFMLRSVVSSWILIYWNWASVKLMWFSYVSKGNASLHIILYLLIYTVVPLTVFSRRFKLVLISRQNVLNWTFLT